MNRDDQLEIVIEKLRWLRLPGMARTLAKLHAEAAKDNLIPLDVVDRLCDEEKTSRLQGAIIKRVKAAKFPEVNTVDGAHATSRCTTWRFSTPGSIPSSSARQALERLSWRGLWRTAFARRRDAWCS
jgi:DNA replication protein DnaC